MRVLYFDTSIRGESAPPGALLLPRQLQRAWHAIYLVTLDDEVSTGSPLSARWTLESCHQTKCLHATPGTLSRDSSVSSLLRHLTAEGIELVHVIAPVEASALEILEAIKASAALPMIATTAPDRELAGHQAVLFDRLVAQNRLKMESSLFFDERESASEFMSDATARRHGASDDACTGTAGAIRIEEAAFMYEMIYASVLRRNS